MIRRPVSKSCYPILLHLRPLSFILSILLGFLAKSWYLLGYLTLATRMDLPSKSNPISFSSVPWHFRTSHLIAEPLEISRGLLGNSEMLKASCVWRMTGHLRGWNEAQIIKPEMGWHESFRVQAPQEQNDWSMNHLLTSDSLPTPVPPPLFKINHKQLILNNSVVCALLVPY